MSAFREQRYLKIRIPLLLLIAVGVLIYEIWLFSLLLSIPTDQTGVYFGRQIIVKQVPAASPLQVGDVILGIGSLDLDRKLLLPSYWHRALFDTEEQGADYTILREDQVLRVFVPWYPYTVPELLWRGAGLWLVGITMVLTAMVIVTARGQELAARLLALAFVMMALNQANNMFPAASANAALAFSWLFIPLDAIGVWFGISLALHGMLIFPEVKAPLRRMPWLPWALHLMTPVLALAIGFLFGGDQVLGIRAMAFDVANPLMLLQSVLLCVALGHTYFTSRKPGVRNQIRWIMWGIVLAFIPWAFFYVLPSLFYNSPWLPLTVTNITVVLIPLSFAISILRFGLMEIDRVINRTLVILASGGVLIALYLLVVTWSGRLIQRISGTRNDFFAGVIGTLALFVAFNPLRVYVQQAVDRTFYREQLDFFQVLREVGQELSTTVFLRDVLQLLSQDVPQRLGLSFANVLLLDETEDAYIGHEDSNGFRVSASMPLIGWFEMYNAPLSLYQKDKLPNTVQESVLPLTERGVELCSPLFQHNELIGLYVCGSKPSGNLLGRDEVNMLELLSQQAATALQNAKLYEELQEYNRMLEARVAARTSELSAERNRLDTIVQNVADGLVVTDRNDNIVLVNPAFSHIVRRSVDQALGKPLEHMLPSDDLCELVSHALHNPGKVYTDDIPAHNLPGTRGRRSQIFKASSCALVQRSFGVVNNTNDHYSEVLGVVTILRDVTHEYEVDRMKTDFISTVSHELRTPLTSVLGFAKLIQKSFERDVIPRLVVDDRRGERSIGRISDNLDIIVSEGERLTRLINDVLDISKMEAGKVEWHLQELEIMGVIHTAVNAMTSLSLENDIPVLIEAEDDLPRIVADRDRLVQVVMNLLSNALKFTSEGRVTVQVKRARVFPHGLILPPLPEHVAFRYLQQSGVWLLVCVQDTGIGIPEDKLPDVFEKFKQVTADLLDSRPQGTGLGLPICREIIEHHEGQIWVESEVGVGSTFAFLLPAIEDGKGPTLPEMPSLAEEEEALEPSASGDRILVVDDDEAIRTLLRQELAEAGYQVLEAADGMEALQKARLKHPDLIILDVMIPGISGFDVASVLKSNAETAPIPIIILSAVEDRERGFRLGADGYLAKPLDAALLLNMIRDVLSRMDKGDAQNKETG